MPNPDGTPTYEEVLTAAVDYVARHGYTSPEEIDYWAEQLRLAAERSMKSMGAIEQMVRESMLAVFRRQVDLGGTLKVNPGVSAYRLQQIKPELHAELNRRIAASVDLIRVNRPQAIEKTLQRFRGWATSVPPGGSPLVKRREQKVELRKALAQLPFAERRVIIDQNAKLASAINTTVAVNGGAIGAIWHSHKKQVGYNGRPDHNERDDKFFLVRGSWAHEAGLVKPNKDGYTDDMEQPAELPFCLPGDTNIPFADGVTKAYRRWYSGELAEIITSSGKSLRGTPNHPVLTPKGWVAMGSLNEGDYVVEASDQGFNISEQDQHDRVTTISEIFGTCEKLGITKSISGKLEQFHGDGSNSNVDIVSVAGELMFGNKPNITNGGSEFNFPMAHHSGTLGCSINTFIVRCYNAGSSLMRSIRKPFSAVDTFISHPNVTSFALPAYCYSDVSKPISHSLSGNAKSFSNRKNAFIVGIGKAYRRIVNSQAVSLAFNLFTPIKTQGFSSGEKGAGFYVEDFGDLTESFPFATQLSKVIKVNRSAFSSHVYNLETSDGWYVANNIVTHNCKCFYQYVYSLRSVPSECLTKKGEEALAEARRKIANATGKS